MPNVVVGNYITEETNVCVVSGSGLDVIYVYHLIQPRAVKINFPSVWCTST